MPACSWANAPQLDFLKSKIVEFSTAQDQKQTKKFWELIESQFFTKWPDQDAEAAAAAEWVPPDGSKPKTNKKKRKNKAGISAASQIELTHAQWVELRKKNIHNWFNNHGSAKAKPGPKIKITIAKSGSRISSEYHLYSKLYFGERIKPSLDAEFGDIKPSIKDINLAIKKAYDNETEEVKAAVRLAQEEERKAKEVSKDSDTSLVESLEVPSPQDYLNAQAALPALIRDFLALMETRTGWAFSVIAGGPDPALEGQIRTMGIHTGCNEHGLSFAKSLPTFIDNVLKPYSAFLKTVFPEHLRSKFLISEEQKWRQIKAASGCAETTENEPEPTSQSDSVVSPSTERNDNLTSPSLAPSHVSAPTPSNNTDKSAKHSSSSASSTPTAAITLPSPTRSMASLDSRAAAASAVLALISPTKLNSRREVNRPSEKGHPPAISKPTSVPDISSLFPGLPKDSQVPDGTSTAQNAMQNLQQQTYGPPMDSQVPDQTRTTQNVMQNLQQQPYDQNSALHHENESYVFDDHTSWDASASGGGTDDGRDSGATSWEDTRGNYSGGEQDNGDTSWGNTGGNYGGGRHDNGATGGNYGSGQENGAIGGNYSGGRQGNGATSWVNRGGSLMSELMDQENMNFNANSVQTCRENTPGQPRYYQRATAASRPLQDLGVNVPYPQQVPPTNSLTCMGQPARSPGFSSQRPSAPLQSISAPSQPAPAQLQSTFVPSQSAPSQSTFVSSQSTFVPAPSQSTFVPSQSISAPSQLAPSQLAPSQSQSTFVPSQSAPSQSMFGPSQAPSVPSPSPSVSMRHSQSPPADAQPTSQLILPPAPISNDELDEPDEVHGNAPVSLRLRKRTTKELSINGYEWLTNGMAYLSQGLDEEKWKQCLQVWEKFEREIRSETTSHRLGAKLRPAILSKWLTNGRQYDNIPVVENVDVLADEWLEWWNAIQPKWRQATGKGSLPLSLSDATEKDNINVLRKGGPTGMIAALIGLKWWCSARDRDERWLQSVSDIMACLESFLGSTKGSTNKRKAGTQESASGTKKRKTKG